MWFKLNIFELVTNGNPTLWIQDSCRAGAELDQVRSDDKLLTIRQPVQLIELWRESRKKVVWCQVKALLRMRQETHAKQTKCGAAEYGQGSNPYRSDPPFLYCNHEKYGQGSNRYRSDPPFLFCNHEPAGGGPRCCRGWESNGAREKKRKRGRCSTWRRYVSRSGVSSSRIWSQPTALSNDRKTSVHTRHARTWCYTVLAWILQPGCFHTLPVNNGGFMEIEHKFYFCPNNKTA